MFNRKMFLIILGITLVLSFLSLAGSQALDLKGDQFDLYYNAIVEGFFHQSFLVMPIFLAFTLCIFVGAYMSSPNKNSEDYICLVGGGTRITLFLSKVLAVSVVIALSLLLYITLQEIATMFFDLNIWKAHIILAYSKVLLNLFVLVAWTILFSVTLKSSLAGIIAPLLYIFAIVANNDTTGSIMAFFRKTFEVVLPLSFYETHTLMAMEKYMLETAPVYGVQWSLIVTFFLLAVSCGIYMKQDL
jgi:ABC-type transport system involved in multi-copper enzyme maturation permease subunit